jgi:hypothetical protein
MKVGRNLLVVADFAPATEWHTMCTDPALDSLTKENCTNPSLAMWMIAKLCVFWVFSFTTLHLLYSGYYLSTLTRQFTSFVEGKFLRFQPRSISR